MQWTGIVAARALSRQGRGDLDAALPEQLAFAIEVAQPLAVFAVPQATSRLCGTFATNTALTSYLTKLYVRRLRAQYRSPQGRGPQLERKSSTEEIRIDLLAGNEKLLHDLDAFRLLDSQGDHVSACLHQRGPKTHKLDGGQDPARLDLAQGSARKRGDQSRPAARRKEDRWPKALHGISGKLASHE